MRTEAWVVRLIYCGRDDGVYRAATWEETDDFSKAYTSGPGVDAGGHDRAGIITHAD